MANILDYLDWRGDLTFDISEFNEVDNLLLSQLVYVDLEGIVPGPESGKKINIVEASQLFFERHDENEIMKKVSMTKTAIYVLKKMAESERFRDTMLFGYVNDISLEEQSQFSVVCASLGDKSVYVSFSGTDDTIVGWRENFNMTYLSETPGQLKAVAYLNGMEHLKMSTVRVGGHSKGGNLAVYAAVKCNPLIQKKIAAVYSNDGPGFTREMVESEAYQEMLPKIKTILPESSIVGMLLEHQEEFEVVKSAQSGIQQHDAMSWEVLGTSFIPVDAIDSKSILLDETMKNWLFQLDKEQRQQIVDGIFYVLEEANIRTVDDFYHIKWKVIQEMFKTKSKLPQETQEALSCALKLLWKNGNDTLKKSVKQAVMEATKEEKGSLSGILKKV